MNKPVTEKWKIFRAAVLEENPQAPERFLEAVRLGFFAGANDAHNLIHDIVCNTSMDADEASRRLNEIRDDITTTVDDANRKNDRFRFN